MSRQRLRDAAIGDGDLRCAIDHHAAHRRIASGDRRRRADRAALQIDGHLGRDAGAPVVEDRPADARLRTRGLVGLGEFDRHDAHRSRHAARLRQRLGHERDLGRRERVEPVHRTRGLRRLHSRRGRLGEEQDDE